MLEKLPDVIGHALRDVRAGLENTVFNQSGLRVGLAAITVSSLAFVDHAAIPVRYTADGPGVSPPLQWHGVPAGTASVVLIVEDADAPTPRPLVQAIVVDLPNDENGALAEGALSSPDHDRDTLHEGRNSFLSAGWLPPDPPPAHGRHRYVFQVFALGEPQDGDAFGGTPGRDEVLDAIRSRALASGCLIGTYERHDTTVHHSSAVLA
ncbi:MAG: YbhB/YbcL family Raf kinase inhibitor-like protein [Polaromonas sp.]|nr:YbhB/YbcL family Raf kinase inhibitor-like protein [Polaromonas sp.]